MIRCLLHDIKSYKRSFKDLQTPETCTPPPPPPPPPITKGTPHLHPKIQHFFRQSSTRNSSFSMFHLTPPIPLPPPPCSTTPLPCTIPLRIGGLYMIDVIVRL